MEPTTNNSPLVVILGETASGKSALAMQIAQEFHGEIIAADSRTIYRGMDIGTAKPTQEERRRVRHHLLDVVEPDQRFTAADFKRCAMQAIADIGSRGKLPLLVGGSGLYIDAVLYDFAFGGDADPEFRARLQRLSVDELQRTILSKGIALPANHRNPRHLIRALETRGQMASSRPLRSNTLVLGLRIDRMTLHEHIAQRVRAMMEASFVEEVRHLVKRYGDQLPAFQAPGYASVIEYLQGSLTLEEAEQATIVATERLAKRQRTWFRRNKSVQWITEQEQAVDLITTFLNK